MGLQKKIDEELSQDKMDHLKEQINSVIYGLAIGDALGVPVEFNERDTYHITKMEGYGTYNQPPGTWSDDTSLTLALVEHLSEKSDLSGLMDKFVAYRQGYLTPFGTCFDIGIATNQAIERYLSGVSPEECGGRGERDNGNGALMRIAPLAFVLKDRSDFTHNCGKIEKYTQVTHAHPRSLVASIIYVQILIDLLFNKSLEETIEDLQPLLEDYFRSNSEYWKEYQDQFRELFDKDFYQKQREEIMSTGYVVDSLKASLWCLGTTETFEEAVLKAVNLGNDTDTIGAITGSFAGALYKLEGMPDRWIQQLVNRELIDEKCQKLLESLSQ